MKRDYYKEGIDKIHEREKILNNEIEKSTVGGKPRPKMDTHYQASGEIGSDGNFANEILKKKDELLKLQNLEIGLAKYGNLNFDEETISNWKKLLDGKASASYLLSNYANIFGNEFSNDPSLVEAFSYELQNYGFKLKNMLGLNYTDAPGLFVYQEPESVKAAYKKDPNYIQSKTVIIDTPKDVVQNYNNYQTPISNIMEFQGPSSIVKGLEGAAYSTGNKVAISVVEGVKVVGTKIGETVISVASSDSSLTLWEKILLIITHPLGVFGTIISSKDVGDYLNSIKDQDILYDPLGIFELTGDLFSKLLSSKYGIFIIVGGGIILYIYIVKPLLI